MKNKLEKFIKDHIDQFDVQKPPLNHQQRFEDKLRTGNKKEAGGTTGIFLKIAAIVVFILGSAIVIYKISQPPVAENIDAAYEHLIASDDEFMLADAEMYYGGILTEYNHKLKSLKNDGNETFVQDVESVLLELEEEYNYLKSELLISLYYDKIAQAIIDNYRLRLVVLEQLINVLESTKTQNNQDEQA